MDGKGCYRDSIFAERFWRSVKYECVYLQALEDDAHLCRELRKYFTWHNRQRPHQGWTVRHPMRCTRSTTDSGGLTLIMIPVRA
ncbi:integrase core domain-containing protein [Litchfieldella xinjiangensis]|uniref:integrase core domain-containing protein n=1 Tax=Litchfieldella xinjiangensis TaxID=1166948 RepID=UPI003BF5FB7B